MIFTSFRAAQAQDVTTLLLENIQPPTGTLYIAVYAATTNGSWQDEPLLQLRNTLNESSSTAIELDLPNGRYAARAYLDRNQNGQLDTDTSGRPLEPFAISLGAKRKKPSFSFSKSVFVISPEQRHIKMILRYPKIRHKPENSANHSQILDDH